ncbi:Broad-range acid phosphatase DET1 [Spathaspora sp. JA1]|nr:Broad-range acid phosphatase DET1 [Spathaspora sp. JA1]
MSDQVSSTITLSSSVLLSLIKHTSENYPSLFSGALLGFEDDQGVIDISHGFPFPYPDQYEGGSLKSRSGGQYQKDILENFKKLGYGIEFQGWFQSTISGNFITSQLVEALAQQQLVNKNSFIIIHDMSSIGKEVSLKGLRLSAGFMEAYQDGKWKSKDLERAKLSYFNIFDELDVVVKNQTLVNLYLANLPQTTTELRELDGLNLASNQTSTGQLLESLYSQIDSFNYDQNNFNYYQRQLQKEQSKINQWKQQRKLENLERVKKGDKELDTEEWKTMFRLPNEPSRFNNLLYSHAIDELADDILKKCDEELTKMRHGESEGNCDKSVNRYTPNHLVPLTENGHFQSLSAGQVLRTFLQDESLVKNCTLEPKRNTRSIMFYTSPYLRTRQTCNNIIEGIKDLPDVEYEVREEPRMREQDFGNFQGTSEEMETMWQERAHYGHFFYRIPYGESAADVYDRVASFNESLFRQFRMENFPNILVLVSHGIWSRVFLMKWFKWSYEEFESLKNIPHCQFLVMKKNSETQKFSLKTPLLTWDDIEEDDIDEEVCKEVVDEMGIISNRNVDQEDLDISMIVKAQREAIESTRAKNKKIQEMYEKIKKQDSKSKYNNKIISRFKYDNQSVVNSEEELTK